MESLLPPVSGFMGLRNPTRVASYVQQVLLPTEPSQPCISETVSYCVAQSSPKLPILLSHSTSKCWDLQECATWPSLHFKLLKDFKMIFNYVSLCGCVPVSIGDHGRPKVPGAGVRVG